MSEPRRWTLTEFEGFIGASGPPIPMDSCVTVIEAAAYDALLAERDALKGELDDHREAYRKTIEDECDTDEKHCACVPFLRSEIKRISEECDEGRCPSTQHEQLVTLALKAELAALKEKADRLHDALQGVAARPFIFCLVCHCGVEHHVPDCPAAPDFLQKAREGR